MAHRIAIIDGTTSSGHYATLSAAETGEGTIGKTLTSAETATVNGWANIALEFQCVLTASADDLAVEFDSGWVTDATHRILIHAPAAYRHSGVWDTSKYRLSQSAAQSTVALAYGGTGYYVIDGLQVETGHADGEAIKVASTPGVLIANCVVKGTDFGIQISGSSCTGNIINNCSVTTSHTAGIALFYNNDAPGTVENSTLISDSTASVYNAGTATILIKNCYGNLSFAGTGSSTCTTCATAANQDKTGVTKNVAFDTTNFESVTWGNASYLKLKTGSALVNAGTDLIGDGGWVLGEVDIAGTTRGTWDIGAFELEEAIYQFARPMADLADGNWLNAASSNTDLFESINDTAATLSDSDYIQSGVNPTDDTYTASLTTVGTPDTGTVTIRIRGRWL